MHLVKLPPDTIAIIDRICASAKPDNPGAYRRVLTRLAERGELDLTKWRGRDEAKKTEEYLKSVDMWRDSTARPEETKDLFAGFFNRFGR